MTAPTITPMSDEELPSVEEALAYADGYAEGLRDAKDQDVAQLILERDSLSGRLGLEKVLRQAAERQVETLKAYCADHYRELVEQRATIDAAKSALSSSRAEVETLRAALIENSDMLAQSVSGFISGCASDEAWNISRDRLVQDARDALASSEAANG